MIEQFTNNEMAVIFPEPGTPEFEALPYLDTQGNIVNPEPSDES